VLSTGERRGKKEDIVGRNPRNFGERKTFLGDFQKNVGVSSRFFGE